MKYRTLIARMVLNKPKVKESEELSIEQTRAMLTYDGCGSFQQRVSQLQDLQACMKWRRVENENSDIWNIFCKLLSQQTIILAINSSYVDPLEQFDTQVKKIEECFRNVFSMPDIETLKRRQSNSDETDDIEQLYQTILTTFEDTLLILISKDLYKLQLLREMIIWMNKETRYLQERVMNIISRVLKYSSRKIKGCTSIDAPCMGQLAAELAILCSYQEIPIVIQASLAIYYLLSIVKYQNEELCGLLMMESGNYPSSVLFENDFTPSTFQRNNAVIAKYVGEYLPPHLLNDFVFGLLKKLCHPPPKTANQAATLLKLVLEDYGSKVTRAAKIVDYIHKKLNIESPHILKRALLRIVALLTRSFPQKVVFQLLDYMFPVDKSVLQMWQAVSSETDPSPIVLKTILIVLKGKPGEVEGSPSQKRFSLDDTNMMPVTAAQALCTLLPVPEYKKAAAQFFPELLIALILQLHYNSEMKLKKVEDQCFAQKALRLLLKSSGLQQVDCALQKKDCWHQFSNLIFHHYGVYIIAKTLSEYKFPQFPETLHYLYKLSLEGPRRTEDSVTTVIFLIELLNNFFKDPFPEEFLALFRTWVNDPNPTVSKLSLQKIATMSSVINKVSNVRDLIVCVLNSFPSKDKTVTIQAMNTLRRLLSEMDKVTYSTLCVQIAFSYFPLMDHAMPSIRAMAIRHFGELLKEMNQYTWMLKPIVLKALVPLILFLEDAEINVVKACKYTLNICAPYFKWSSLPVLQDEYYNFEVVVLSICNSLFNNYGNYITEIICSALVYLKNSRAYLRKGAVILVGYLAKLGTHLLFQDEIDIMLKAMEKVLSDEDPSVKRMADFTYMLFKEVSDEVMDNSLKQVFRRLCHLHHFKDMTLLYNYRGRERSDSCYELDEYKI
ncbi:maestro heat-like repeat-containing protein family member 9 isoform X1 [Sarcophilus harrisii]|uniref:Maestro heat like repeat family member 9 n=1 Tax=Sarcophilus harrisii TaxID=9305 RepID=A0A7N4PFX3_SARHA|nr:maestro heat-like repeat-containing protein family member 9 isoform X1 [Sarcophilus harrisii]